MELPDIPESIPVERVEELVAALGLPVEHLSSFRLQANAIVAVYYALDEDGHRYALFPDNEAATHTVTIRIEREDLSRFEPHAEVKADPAGATVAVPDLQL